MKITLYMAQSVNGYIATKEGDTPWSDEEWESYSNTIKKFKNLIIGRRTYEIMKKDNNFEKLGNPFTVILTNKKVKNNDKFAFVQSPQKAIELLKEKGFEEIILGGGGSANSSFMKENLIDEIILDVEPVLFGRGIKLFSDEDFKTDLELLDVKKISDNVVQLKYKVKK